MSSRYFSSLTVTDHPSTVLSSSAKVMVFNFIGGGKRRGLLPLRWNRANTSPEIEERYDDITCKNSRVSPQTTVLTS